MQSEGITWQPTSPYKPHQNGVAERCFRTLFERARAILYDSGLPAYLWEEVIMTVTYLKNRSPTRVLSSHGTPYEEWYNKKPDLSHLRAFGSIAYHCNEGPHQKKRGKKSWRSVKCQLLGY